MISIELLEKILGCDCFNVDICLGEITYSSYKPLNKLEEDIMIGDIYNRRENLFEAADKVRDWIISQDYLIETAESSEGCYLYLYNVLTDDNGIRSIDKNNGRQFDLKSYIELIFECGEYVLNKNLEV